MASEMWAVPMASVASRSEIVGAGAEAQARHGALEQALAVGGDVAVLADLTRAH
jgi:hypothetical protein